MQQHKTRIVNAYVSGDVTANDTVCLQYNRNQEKLRLTSKPLKMLYGGLYACALKQTNVYAETTHANVLVKTAGTSGVAMRRFNLQSFFG